MLFIFSTPVLIRHLRQLKTVVFLHWCLIHVVLLGLTSCSYQAHSEMTSWQNGMAPKKSGALFTTLYFIRNLHMGPISQNVCFLLAFPAYPNVLVDTAYTSESPFRCSTQGQVPVLKDKHQTRLEDQMLQFIRSICKLQRK